MVVALLGDVFWLWLQRRGIPLLLALVGYSKGNRFSVAAYVATGGIVLLLRVSVASSPRGVKPTRPLAEGRRRVRATALGVIRVATVLRTALRANEDRVHLVRSTRIPFENELEAARSGIPPVDHRSRPSCPDQSRGSDPRLARFRKAAANHPLAHRKQWMKINLPTTLVSQHEARRKAWLAGLVVFESALPKGLPSRVEITRVQSEVEV